MQVQMYFQVGDYSVIITDAVIVTWIAVIIMLIFVAILLGKPSKNHKLTKGQTILVSLTELIISTAMGFGMNRKQAEEVTPMIMTFGLVLIACNSISYFHLPPPAKNVAFPIGCAITAILYVIVMTIKFVGLKGFWLSLTQPIIIMLPFKLLDYVVKPLSLALRLFGNVFAAFVFMEFLSISIPLILPGVAGLWFDIIDGMIQAVVFSYLTMSYIGENVETVNEYYEHPEEHEKKKKSKKTKAVAA
jgi:F-type H+-transporting ATPase subunit a